MLYAGESVQQERGQARKPAWYGVKDGRARARGGSHAGVADFWFMCRKISTGISLAHQRLKEIPCARGGTASDAGVIIHYRV